MNQLLADMYNTGADRIRQWARAGIGRLTGTTLATDGAYKASLELAEARLLHRAELTAIGRILIDREIATQTELCQAFVDAMNDLEVELAKQWPEHRVPADGRSVVIKDIPALAARCKRERWPA